MILRNGLLYIFFSSFTLLAAVASDSRKAKYTLLLKAWKSPSVWKCHRIGPFCRIILFVPVFIRQKAKPSEVITVSYRGNGTGRRGEG
jgi:hypothetical protein